MRLTSFESIFLALFVFLSVFLLFFLFKFKSSPDKLRAFIRQHPKIFPHAIRLLGVSVLCFYVLVYSTAFSIIMETTYDSVFSMIFAEGVAVVLSILIVRSLNHIFIFSHRSSLSIRSSFLTSVAVTFGIITFSFLVPLFILHELSFSSILQTVGCFIITISTIWMQFHTSANFSMPESPSPEPSNSTDSVKEKASPSISTSEVTAPVVEESVPEPLAVPEESPEIPAPVISVCEVTTPVVEESAPEPLPSPEESPAPSTPVLPTSESPLPQNSAAKFSFHIPKKITIGLFFILIFILGIVIGLLLGEGYFAPYLVPSSPFITELQQSEHDAGYDEGHEEGYRTGYQYGRHAGYNGGYDDGYSEGYSEGRTETYSIVESVLEDYGIYP